MKEAVADVAQRVAKKRPGKPRFRSGFSFSLRPMRQVELLMPTFGCGHTCFISGNQGRDRRKRKLETCAHDRFWLEQNDEAGGKREIAHRQSLPVEHDRHQHMTVMNSARSVPTR